MLLIKVLLQVLYDDGEVEILNLRKQKWELLDDDEVRFLAIDDQTLFPFCFLKLIIHLIRESVLSEFNL